MLRVFVQDAIYSALLGEIYEKKAREAIKEFPEQSKDKVIYLSSKDTDYSWKYPIFYKALNNLQIKTALQTLLDERFDPAQREYTRYKYQKGDNMSKYKVIYHWSDGTDDEDDNYGE